MYPRVSATSNQRRLRTVFSARTSAFSTACSNPSGEEPTSSIFCKYDQTCAHYLPSKLPKTIKSRSSAEPKTTLASRADCWVVARKDNLLYKRDVISAA